MKWLCALLAGLYAWIPAPGLASYVFTFKPISVLGTFPSGGAIVITDEGYAAGSVSGFVDAVPFGGKTGELESFSLGPFNAEPPLFNPLPIPVFRYDLTVIGDHLAGSFLGVADGGLSLVQGSGTADAWLIGIGQDGGSCFGSQDPTHTSGPPGEANQCRAAGVWVLQVSEPSGLAVLCLSVAGLLAASRRRLVERRNRPMNWATSTSSPS